MHDGLLLLLHLLKSTLVCLERLRKPLNLLVHHLLLRVVRTKGPCKLLVVQDKLHVLFLNRSIVLLSVLDGLQVLRLMELAHKRQLLRLLKLMLCQLKDVHDEREPNVRARVIKQPLLGRNTKPLMVREGRYDEVVTRLDRRLLAHLPRSLCACDPVDIHRNRLRLVLHDESATVLLDFVASPTHGRVIADLLLCKGLDLLRVVDLDLLADKEVSPDGILVEERLTPLVHLRQTADVGDRQWRSMLDRPSLARNLCLTPQDEWNKDLHGEIKE